MKKFMISLLFMATINAKAGTIYTVFVCSDPTFEDALRSKEREIKEPAADIFIIRSEAGPYRIGYGAFQSYAEAERFRKNLPTHLQKRSPYTQKLSEEYLSRTDEGKVTHFRYEPSDDGLKPSLPEYSKTGMAERAIGDAGKKPSMEMKPKNLSSYDPTLYDSLILYIDSEINRMFVNGYQQNTKVRLGSFRISSAKKEVKKPLGRGNITSIVLHPIWYPTEDTIKEFKAKKNIELPKAVPAGDRYNYMGSAKIALSHTVDGRQTYRIHGTRNENTIGSKESAGCIRMRNSEVEELANFLKKYAHTKGMDRIEVVIR
jgi:hypothetical protein